MSNSKLPKLVLTSDVLDKIFAYAKACPTEISGFGMKNKSGTFDRLLELLPQVCTGTETEMGDKEMAALAMSKESKNIQLWWHSHVSMNCFWSSTDEAAIKTLGVGIDLLYSIVVNKNLEYKARIDIFRPLRFTWDDVDVEEVKMFPLSLIKQVRKEVSSKVKRPPPPKIIHQLPQHTPILPGWGGYYPGIGGNNDHKPFNERYTSPELTCSECHKTWAECICPEFIFPFEAGGQYLL